MRVVALLLLCFLSACSNASEKTKILSENSCDSIYVSKSKRIMYLYSNKVLLKSYTISIGYNPVGHKQYQGDNRTPEGLYFINDKNPNSAYYKNLGISYPNDQDRKHARKLKRSPGGDIKIHGYADNKGSTRDTLSRYEYTWGCLGLCNKDMKEVYQTVKVGAKIYIAP